MDIRLPMIDGAEGQRAEIWKNFKQWSRLLSTHGLSLDKLYLGNGHLWYLDVSLGALAAAYNESTSTPAEALQAHSVAVVVEQNNGTEKIERLIDALKRELLLGFMNIRSIDLRYPNGFAVAWIDQNRKVYNADHVSSGLQ